MSEEGPRPVLPHMAGEFYAWVWWRSEEQSGRFDLGEALGKVDLWVDERLAFRNPEDSKVSAVMTGDNPSATLEARAALAGGKVIAELRLGLRRDDREFIFSLKGPAMDLQRMRVPQMVKGGDEAIYDRMHLYEELFTLVSGLYAQFAAERTSSGWADTVAAMRGWVHGNQPGEAA
jgi:hypothetical protein